MKVILRLAVIGAVAVALVAAATPAMAACASGRALNQCVASVYITSAGQSTTSSVHGSFWGVGGGNPTPGPGDDNGILAPTTAQGSTDPWLIFYPAGFCLSGNWASGGVDGCWENATTPSPKRTAVAVTDSDAPGPSAKGYFGVLCKEPAADLNFDFSTLGPLALAPIPYPHITSSSRVVATSVTVNVRAASANTPAGAVLGDPTCTNLIRGYKICTQTRPNGAGQPGDRGRTAGWVCGSEIAFATDAPPQTYPCTADTSVYVATSLVFESGFETDVVSEHRRVPCDGNLADRPGDFKKIPKPRSLPRRQQSQ